MYLLLRKVLHNGRRAKIFYAIIFPTSAPQICRYQQEHVNGAQQVIAWSPSFLTMTCYKNITIFYLVLPYYM